jgi:hypothetical protein
MTNDYFSTPFPAWEWTRRELLADLKPKFWRKRRKERKYEFVVLICVVKIISVRFLPIIDYIILSGIILNSTIFEILVENGITKRFVFCIVVDLFISWRFYWWMCHSTFDCFMYNHFNLSSYFCCMSLLRRYWLKYLVCNIHASFQHLSAFHFFRRLHNR